jgi:hypothetical protein
VPIVLCGGGIIPAAVPGAADPRGPIAAEPCGIMPGGSAVAPDPARAASCRFNWSATLSLAALLRRPVERLAT